MRGIISALLLYTLSANAKEVGNILPNGFGVASPSVTTLLHGLENPAGAARVDSFKVQLLGYANENDYNPMSYSGGLFFGNGSMGAGVAGTGRAGSNVSNSDTDFLWGLGIDLSNIGFVLGVKGITTGGDNSSTDTQWGILFGRRSFFKFGATVTSSENGRYDFGGGFSFDLAPNVNFSLDALHDRSDTQFSYAAGLHVSGNIGELLAGYKIIDSSNEDETHFYGGVALTYWQSLSIEFLYNYLSLYCLGLTFKF